MPLRTLLRYLMGNDQVIQKLSESYPIRRAAQLSAYLFFKGKAIGQESLEKLKDANVVEKTQNDAKEYGRRLSSFKETFTKEFKDGMKELDEKQKKR